MQRLATARTLQAARESGTCGLQEHADATMTKAYAGGY